MDRLQELLKTECNYLGSGSNGQAFDIGNNKVLKIYYDSEIKKCDKPFIEWCSKHDSKVFPKVYEIGVNWYTLEKLKTNTKKIKQLFNLLDYSYINEKSLFNIIKDRDCCYDQLSHSQKWVYNWCKQCQEDFKKINHRLVNWPGDLVIDNVGERSNGDIIFFDI